MPTTRLPPETAAPRKTDTWAWFRDPLGLLIHPETGELWERDVPHRQSPLLEHDALEC